MGCDEHGSSLLFSCVPKPLTSVSSGENMGQIPTEVHSLQYLRTSQYLQGRSQEEPKKTWRLNVIWHPGWDPGTKRGHTVNSRESWIDYGPWLVITFSIVSLIVTSVPCWWKILLTSILRMGDREIRTIIEILLYNWSNSKIKSLFKICIFQKRQWVVGGK